MKSAFWLFLLVTAYALLLGCTGTRPTVPTTAPKPPFTLSRPLPVGNVDPRLASLSVNQLAAVAMAAAREQQYELASAAQRLAIDQGHLGYYNLACFEGRLGHVDQSIYWLQVAAEKEGVDSAWTSEDPDLELLRKDRRWKKLHNFLSTYQRFWEHSDKEDHCLVVPTDYRGDPIPVMVWLHGLGDRAESYRFSESQQLADKLNIAFLSVSGTRVLGPASFAWSDDMASNLKRIDGAFEKFSDRLKPQTGRIALGGFSQGGMVAGELVARDPQRFSGALVMSPGGFPVTVGSNSIAPQHRNLVAVCLCGGGEDPGTVSNTDRYAQWFRKAGALVENPSYPDMKQHSLVPDFHEQLPNWLPKLLRAKD
jgi:predicted esterase